MLINRNFSKLWLAAGASNLADGVGLVAFPWIASLITRDPVAVALVAVFLRGPWFFFSLPAGVLTDRFDRRRIMVLMDFIRFVVMSAFALIVFFAGDIANISDGASRLALLGVLYCAALIFGMCEVLRDNAGQTILPSLVAKHQLEAANGKFSAVEMLLNGLAGPPIAGFLIAIALFMPLAVNAAAFLFAAIMVLAIVPSSSPSSRTKADAASPTSFWFELKSGFGWLWRFPILRDLALILGGVNAAFMMGVAIYVLFAQEVLGLDAAGYGLLLTAGALGGFIGSFIVPWLGRWFDMRFMLLFAMGLMAFENTAIGLASNFAFAWVVIFIGGIGIVGWNIHTVSFRQRIIPDALLGRVNSVYRFFGWGMMPLGTLLGGLCVQIVEPFWGREWALRSPFLLAAIICGLLGLYATGRLTRQKISDAESRAAMSAA